MVYWKKNQKELYVENYVLVTQILTSLYIVNLQYFHYKN